MTLKQLLKQCFCDHQFEVKSLDLRFTVDRDDQVNHWMCCCKHCGKKIPLESRRRLV